MRNPSPSSGRSYGLTAGRMIFLNTSSAPYKFNKRQEESARCAGRGVTHGGPPGEDRDEADDLELVVKRKDPRDGLVRYSLASDEARLCSHGA